MLNQAEVNHINKSLEMLKTFPVFVTCSGCSSGNVITNSHCCGCGMPLGQVVEDKIDKYKRMKARASMPRYSPKFTSSGSAFFSFAPSYSMSLSEPPASPSLSLSPSEAFDSFDDDELYDPTPIYAKCANCLTLNNIREKEYCICGMPTSVEEIDNG